jgi:hypothetical protein
MMIRWVERKREKEVGMCVGTHDKTSKKLLYDLTAHNLRMERESKGQADFGKQLLQVGLPFPITCERCFKL